MSDEMDGSTSTRRRLRLFLAIDVHRGVRRVYRRVRRRRRVGFGAAGRCARDARAREASSVRGVRARLRPERLRLDWTRPDATSSRVRSLRTHVTISRCLDVRSRHRARKPRRGFLPNQDRVEKSRPTCEKYHIDLSPIRDHSAVVVSFPRSLQSFERQSELLARETSIHRQSFRVSLSRIRSQNDQSKDTSRASPRAHLLARRSPNDTNHASIAPRPRSALTS